MWPRGSPEGLGTTSAATSEKHASSPASPPPPPAPAPTPASTSAQKPRSCVICRRRKVRCDKISPCSNCRRANIPCVFPSTDDRPPRWARRLDRLTNNAVQVTTADPQRLPDPASLQVMERLKTLEALVKDLSGQLEQANAAATSAQAASRSNSTADSPQSSADIPDRDRQLNSSSAASGSGSGVVNLKNDFGRLYVKDDNSCKSRYVSSNFWSRINDELDGLKTDLGGDGDPDASEDEGSPDVISSTHELDRPPADRHAFLFRHNLAPGVNLQDLHPLPSQIPFLLNTFSENVNYFIQIVHVPYMARNVRALRGTDLSNLPVRLQALLFSISYAAVTSMEEDDVMMNFGATKAELNMKYRIGLEHSLAQADFLNVPDLGLVQAFAIFLLLSRRHDSPRFVWMMTGLVIRMAQALGLHRDGSHYPHLTPFEVEMRRRAWWSICVLDLRASEDQGTDFTIARSSFDTKLFLNINDADIDIDTKETPPERQGITDTTVSLLMFKISDISKQIATPGTSIEEQEHLLIEMQNTLDRGYLQYAKEPGNLIAWAGATCVQLVISKMRLIAYLPALLSSGDQRFSDETRNKLLVAAIEVAEYNHALNSEESCRQWRWVYQTYTHWYAIVYLLIEVIRRPLSPTIERAWIALHSKWLIPTNHTMNSTSQIWVPLKKMMIRARQHRQTELTRLWNDVDAVMELEIADRLIPVPASSGPFPPGRSDEYCRQHWRNLVTMPSAEPGSSKQAPNRSDIGSASHLSSASGAPEVSQQQNINADLAFAGPNICRWPMASFGPALLPPDASQLSSQQNSPFIAADQNTQPGPVLLEDWLGGRLSDPNGQDMPWLWADDDAAGQALSGVDINMDMGGDVDWLSWMESAKNMESNQDTT